MASKATSERPTLDERSSMLIERWVRDGRYASALRRMAGSVDGRPAAESDLVEIWVHIARVNERAADQKLDLVRVPDGAMDIGPIDVV